MIGQNLIMYFSTAFKQLHRNRGRSFLTMLGIIIGTGSVIFIMTIGEVAKEFLRSQISRFGTNVMEIAVQGEFGPFGENSEFQLLEQDVRELKNSSLLPEVTAVSGGFSVMQTIFFENKKTQISIFGDFPEYASINHLNILRGRFYLQSDLDNKRRVLVITKNLAEDFFSGINEAVGQQVKIGDVFFEIIGVTDDLPLISGGMSPEVSFAPISSVKYFFADDKDEKVVSYILMEFTPGTFVESLTNRVDYELRRLHNIEPSEESPFAIVTREQFLEIFDTIFFGIQLFVSAVAAISLIVGGIGIMNIMLVTVKERTKEIGLRKAIGAKNSSILAQFLIEALVLTTLGGIIGTVGSVGMSILAVFVLQYLEPTWGVQFVFVPKAVILACAVAGIVGIIFGLYPAIKASKLHPIEALRYE